MEHKTIKSSKKTKNKQQRSKYDLVNFYLQPEFMQIISQQIAGQSAINSQKIESIKQAIANKTFKVNPANVAEKMINFETELFNNSKN